MRRATGPCEAGDAGRVAHLIWATGSGRGRVQIEEKVFIRYLIFAYEFMQVFDKADGDHDRRAGQPEKEERLEKVSGKAGEGVHDAHSTVR